jgi:heptosyltransferase-3
LAPLTSRRARFEREDSEAVHRILVVVTRQIGDVLLTTPLIRAARERWPEARVDVLGFGGTLGMLTGNDDVSDVIEVPARRDRTLAGSWRLLRRLWRRYDLALIAQHSDRAHFYGFVAAPLRAGLVAAAWRHSWWKRALLAHAVTIAGDRGSTHVAEEKLSLLSSWPQGPMDRADGSALATPRAAAGNALALTMVPPARTALPAELSAQLKRRPVVVHAPSMWRYKAWPTEHFRELTKALLDDGHQVVLTGSASATDRATLDALADLGAPPQLLDTGGRLDFGQLASLLDQAALYIGPDTAVTHLAAALHIPVIALFGPSNPVRWGPLDPQSSPMQTGYVRYSEIPQRRGRVVLIQGPGSCVPCGRAGCDDHQDSRSDCLEALSPSLVIAQARRLLAGSNPAVD